jgi:eukaryotic-like serine/threonine-protein kinase
VQSLTTGERTIVHDGGGFGRYAPTGHLLYAIGGTLFAEPFDLKRRKVTGPAVSVVEGVRRPNLVSAAPGSVYYSVSDSGTLMYIPGPLLSSGSRQSAVAFFDRSTGVVEPLKIRPALYQFPRVSPDGKRVAVATDDGKAADVWIYELSGEVSLRQLTLGGRNRFPVWSGDGHFVAFQSDREGDSGIWWQRADGSLAVERLTIADQGTAHIPESWSPDGRVLLFAEAKGANYTIWTLSFPGRKKARFGDIESPRPPSATFSSDGRWVAYASSDASAVPTVFVQPFPATGVKIPIARNAFHPLWSPDGASLYYRLIGTRSEVVTVKKTPAFSFGTPRAASIEVLRSTGNTPRQFDITPDGKRLIGIVSAGRLEAGEVSQIHVVLNWFEELKRLVPSN